MLSLFTEIKQKIKTRKVLFFVSVGTLSSILRPELAFSQHSYKPGIVFIYGDSRPGLVKISNEGEIHFINKEQDKMEVSIKAIDSVSINGINYQKYSNDNDTKDYLLRFIIKGQNSLRKVANSKEDLFVVSNNDSLTFLTQQNSFNELRKLTYDINSQSINSKIIKSKKNITERLISNVIYDYNLQKYPNEKPIKFKENLSVALGVFGGINLSQINYIGHDKGAFFQYNGLLSRSIDPSFGVFANLNPLNQFSFEINFYYSESSGSREALPYVPVEPDRSERVSLKEEAFHIPLLVNYKMYFTKLPIYLKLGPKYVLFKKIEDYYTFNNGIEKPIFLFDRHFGFGFDAGLGIEKTIYNKSLVRLEYKFGYHSIQDEVTRMATNSNHSLTLKYALILHKKVKA